MRSAITIAAPTNGSPAATGRAGGKHGRETETAGNRCLPSASSAELAHPTIAVNRIAAIYVNDAGKALLDRLAGAAGLTGIECGMPGPL